MNDWLKRSCTRLLVYEPIFFIFFYIQKIIEFLNQSYVFISNRLEFKACQSEPLIIWKNAFFSIGLQNWKWQGFYSFLCHFEANKTKDGNVCTSRQYAGRAAGSNLEVHMADFMAFLREKSALIFRLSVENKRKLMKSPLLD